MPKSKSAPKKQTKTAYVLSLPHALPAKEVVAKGKAAGVSLTVAHVYAIRSGAKARKSKGRKAHSSNGHATVRHHAVGSHKAEDLLRAVASELGLAHAMSILKAEHDRV